MDELIEWELAYINTNHPNFIGGAAALQSVARGSSAPAGNTNSANFGSRHFHSSAHTAADERSSWFGGLFGSSERGDAASKSSAAQSAQAAARAETERARRNNVSQREAQQVELLRSILGVSL